MEGYDIQPWLVWSIVTVLLMMGAWMRVGAYLFYLGLASLLALVEALFEVRLRWQIVSFVVASCMFALFYWSFAGGSRQALPSDPQKKGASAEDSEDGD